MNIRVRRLGLIPEVHREVMLACILMISNRIGARVCVWWALGAERTEDEEDERISFSSVECSSFSIVVKCVACCRGWQVSHLLNLRQINLVCS
jgi:hypothetical protein